MRIRTSIVALAVVLMAVFALLALVPRLVPSHRLLFSFFFLYLVMFPGYLLAHLLLPWTRGLLRILAAFILGVTLCFAILIMIALFRADIRLLGSIVPVTTIALSFLYGSSGLARSRWGKGIGDGIEEPGKDEERRRMYSLGKKEVAIALFLMAAVAFLILRTGDPLFLTNDSADHIAYIRTITHSHQVFPEQWYYKDGGKLTHDIRRGLLHALWGTLNSFTGRVDAVAIWPLTSVIGSIFFIIALLYAGVALFQSATIGLISAFLFVLIYHGGLKDIELVSMAYGTCFGKVFYLTALSFIPVYLRRPDFGYLSIITCSFFAATGTHINFLWIAMFLLFVVALTRLIHERGAGRTEMLFKRIPLLAIAVLVINLPYVGMRYIRDYAPNNPIYMHVQGILYFTDRMYVLEPTLFFREAGMLGALAMASIPVLWRKTHADESLRLLLYGLLSFYVLVFNPLWFPLLHKKMLYLLVRFEFLVPSMTICAYLIYELWRKARNMKSDLSRCGAVFGWVCVAIFIGYPLAVLPRDFIYSKKKIASRWEYSYRNMSDLYDFINRTCPPGRVFLSDVFTSYSIPTFTDQFVVCMLDQHSIPNDSTAEVRIAACREIYTPTTPVDRVEAILDTYGVDYVVINGRIPAGAGALYWKPNLDVTRSVIERFRGLDSLFAVVYERRNLAVFRFNKGYSGYVGRSDEKPLPFLGDSIRIENARSFAASGQPGILIEKVALNRESVMRGDSLQVRITWVATEKRPLQRYAMFLRFDTDFEKNALYRESYGKPYRKVLEKVKRERYRFRADFLPLGGIYPPDTWPPLREVRDAVTVTVPRDVAPGAYAISLKLEVTPQFPNYHLRDLLSDRDYYSGVEVARITIE